MRNRLVPRSEWFRFFEEFSRRHEGWLVTVRVLGASFGSQVEARDLPLEGIVSAAEATGPISIHLGDPTTSNLEHEIEEPKQVWIELSQSGAEEALGVVAGDGTKTIVEFRSPGRPETGGGHPPAVSGLS